MSTTANEAVWHYMRNQDHVNWMPEPARGDDKLKLKRVGKKKFIVKREFGAVLATYKCGYPEAKLRFAAFVVTRRLLDSHESWWSGYD